VIEIRFSSSWAGIDSKAPFLEKVISEFEATYPNIKIINESMYGEDFLFTLKADFASGNGPDVFGLWPGSDLELLIENGLIADLSPILIEDQIWSDNFDPKVFEFLDQGYQTYSIPFEVIYEGLYINEDLFEAYGVTVPKDFDELLEVIEVFRNADIIPIAYNLTPEGSFIYQNMIVQLAGKYDTENPIKRDGSIKSGYIDAMYKMKELYDSGAFPDDAFTLNDAARNNLFIEKKAAMIAQGSWFNSEKLDETIGIIPFPIKSRNKTAIIYGIGNGNFHLTKAAYDDPIRKDAALLFLKYLTSEKSREIFNSSPSFISTSSAVPTGYLNRIGLDLTHQADELVGPPDHYINRNFWESILIKEFPNMLEGKITPEAIFKKLEDY
jgi:raffinose/stachyose/melibiose transport system substrate-binding protein